MTKRPPRLPQKMQCNTCYGYNKNMKQLRLRRHHHHHHHHHHHLHNHQQHHCIGSYHCGFNIIIHHRMMPVLQSLPCPWMNYCNCKHDVKSVRHPINDDGYGWPIRPIIYYINSNNSSWSLVRTTTTPVILLQVGGRHALLPPHLRPTCLPVVPTPDRNYITITTILQFMYWTHPHWIGPLCQQLLILPLVVVCNHNTKDPKNHYNPPYRPHSSTLP